MGGLEVSIAPALTMKLSGLFPFVLLALGILALWAVEGAENGELEIPWSHLGCNVRGGVGMSASLDCELSLASGDVPGSVFMSTWAPGSLCRLLSI